MTEIINEPVKTFLLSFLGHIQDQHIVQINLAYESGWNKITEKHLKQSEWPSPDAVANLVNHDKTFMLLYKEMYLRHLFANQKLHQGLSLGHRISSWENYLELFDHLLDPNVASQLDLPMQWVWDIIDEFVYQFQEFHYYHLSKRRSKSDEQITSEQMQSRSNVPVWDVRTVLHYLNEFKRKSNIVYVLSRCNPSSFRYFLSSPAILESLTSNNQTLPSLLHLNFGYFSLVCLLRVHCLIGDYHSALKSVECIQPNNKSLYSILSAYTTLYYYTGFAFMMTRRFVDAIRAFSHILLYISRLKQSHNKTYQIEDAKKKNEQVYSLLAILISFYPQRVDEYVSIVLRETFAEKMIHMQRGDISVVEDLFSFGCPKFVTPVVDSEILDYTANNDMLKLQSKLLVNEIKQQSLLPIIRSYLKLYTTIDIPKLANLLERKVDEDILRKNLVCYNHKTKGLTSGQHLLGSKLAIHSDIEFFIEGDMIHIFDAKVPRRYGEYFTRQINKIEDLVSELKHVY